MKRIVLALLLLALSAGAVERQEHVGSMALTEDGERQYHLGDPVLGGFAFIESSPDAAGTRRRGHVIARRAERKPVRESAIPAGIAERVRGPR